MIARRIGQILALLEPAWLSRHRLAEVLFAVRAARQWRPRPWGRSGATEAFLAERATLALSKADHDRCANYYRRDSDPPQRTWGRWHLMSRAVDEIPVAQEATGDSDQCSDPDQSL